MDAAIPDSIARAKELIELIQSPTAVATVILLAFATAQLGKNADEDYQQTKTLFALAASVAAVVITAAIVLVMIPLTVRVLVTNAGNPIDTTLLVYLLTHVVAVGTAVYAIWVTVACALELKG